VQPYLALCQVVAESAESTALPTTLNLVSRCTRNMFHANKQAVIDCVLDIQRWSNSHHLNLNAAKSEVIWLGTQQQIAKLSQANLTLSMGDSVLQPSSVQPC